MKLKNVSGIILSAFCIFIFASCNDDDDDNTDFMPVEFTKIGQGSLSGSGWEGISKSNLVITNETDWENLIHKMFDKTNTVNEATKGLTETTIDFDKYQVIAVFLDIKNSGWEVEIDKIVENKYINMVSTKETEYATTVITQPYCIVKIPKTDKEISFWNELIYYNLRD